MLTSEDPVKACMSAVFGRVFAHYRESDEAMDRAVRLERMINRATTCGNWVGVQDCSLVDGRPYLIRRSTSPEKIELATWHVTTGWHTEWDEFHAATRGGAGHLEVLMPHPEPDHKSDTFWSPPI